MVKIIKNGRRWVSQRLNIVAHLTAENIALHHQLIVLKRNQNRLYWSSEFGLPMQGRMNAVLDRSDGALVSDEYRAGTFPVSFSTTNHLDSSAGTDLFL